MESLADECSFEPAGFNAHGIRQHILDVLNKRRRKCRNGHDYTQVNGCLVHLSVQSIHSEEAKLRKLHCTRIRAVKNICNSQVYNYNIQGYYFN